MILLSILTWWFFLQLFGLVGLPLAFRLLGNLPDRGYALARPLGLLLSGYALWLGGSLGFWQNSLGGILIAMLLVAAAGVWLYRGRRDKAVSLWGWLRAHRTYWLAVEILFAAGLVAWAVYKAYNPNLETAGGEKWMEIAFVNATLRSDRFPPQDPWLAGFGISYYYFGYVLMAMLARLSGLPPTVAINLCVPALLALTLTGAFSIVYNLVAGRQAEAGPLGTSASVAADERGDFTYRRSPAGSAVRVPQEEEEGSKRRDAEEQRSRGAEEEPRAAMGAGLLGALFVGVLGNLEGLLEVLHSRGLLPAGFWRWLDILEINQPPTPGPWIPTRFIWWWRASRVIHDCSFQGLLTGDCNPPNNWEVIDEFPFFSFLLADVHPHVLALPFVLLTIGLALNLLLRESENQGITQPSNHPISTRSVQSLISNLISSTFGGWAQFVIYALCLGALGFLNTWDFPIYLLVVTLAFLAWRARGGGPQTAGRTDGLPGGPHTWPTAGGGWLLETIAVGLGLGLLGGLLYLPFYLGFQSQAAGILPNLFNPTRLQQFLVFFGPFLFVVISYLAVLSRQALRNDWARRLPAALAVTLLGPPLIMLVVGGSLAVSPSARGWVEGLLRDPALQALLGDASLGSLVAMVVRIRLANPWTFLFLGGLLAWVLLLANSRSPTEEPQPSGLNPRLTRADTFALILILVGLLLPLVVEFVYLRDLFGQRINTVFKFYFQAWVLLALAAAYGVPLVAERLKGAGGLAWRAALILLVLSGLVYPVLAIPNKAGDFRGPPTLDGMAWVEDVYPDDYAAIRWLQANAPDGAVILEAPGKSYSYLNRVSALTGLPTVVGWDFHECQWRGTCEEAVRRQGDVDVLYDSTDPTQTLTLLDKYAITYVYVGGLERERYNPNGLIKFERLMDPVFRQGEVTIYQRKADIDGQ